MPERERDRGFLNGRIPRFVMLGCSLASALFGLELVQTSRKAAAVAVFGSVVFWLAFAALYYSDPDKESPLGDEDQEVVE
ncbi:hypothetical protein [Haloparvum sp. AD34]